MNYRLTRYEMETPINSNAEEKTATLYSQDKSVIRHMDKLVAEFPDVYKCTEQTAIGKTYIFPKKYALPRRPRILSDEQREKMRERFAKVRAEQIGRDISDDDLDDDFDDDFDADSDDDSDDDFDDESDDDEVNDYGDVEE